MRVKDYLSYSQFSTFTSSRANYIKIYIEGRKFQTKYTQFGSFIAEALETRSGLSRDEKLAVEGVHCPQYREHEISVDVDGVPCYGRLDGFDLAKDKKSCTIHEYKTGKKPWTQSMVDNSEQLTFYAIMVHKKYGIPLNKIHIELTWWGTYEDIDGSIHLTGERSEPLKTTTGS